MYEEDREFPLEFYEPEEISFDTEEEKAKREAIEQYEDEIRRTGRRPGDMDFSSEDREEKPEEHYQLDWPLEEKGYRGAKDDRPYINPEEYSATHAFSDRDMMFDDDFNSFEAQ